MIKPDTKFWIKIGYNEFFHRYHGFGPYGLCGFGFVIVLILIIGLPYFVFVRIIGLSNVFWIMPILIVIGISLGILTAIRIAYILYINEIQ